MAAAMIYPGGSGKGANPKNLGLSGEYVRQARTVLSVLPELAVKVRDGALCKVFVQEMLRHKVRSPKDVSRQGIFGRIRLKFATRPGSV